jgi:hypothetical protein
VLPRTARCCRSREAKVSVLDRGFIFGDGIYDVTPVYGRRLFRFDEHMARLQRGLDKIRIANPAHARAVARALPAAGGGDWRKPPAPRTRWSTSRSRAAWRPRDHVMPAGHHAHGLHDEQPACARPAPSSATTAWPASPRATSAGSAVTSRARACWATCWPADLGRPRRGRDDHVPRRLADRSVGEQRLDRARGGAARARPRASMCWKASAWSCCANCARTSASPTTCAPSPRPTCMAADEVLLQLGHQGSAAGDEASTGSRSATVRCVASPGRCTRALRGLPGRQADACGLRPFAPCARDPARAEPDRVPERLPDQGDGRAGRGLRRGHRRGRAALRPGLRPRHRRAARQQRRQATWA